MNKLIILTSVSLFLLSGCGKPKDKYRNLIKPGKANVILITGQSNASGNSPFEYLENKSPEIYNKYKNGNENILTNYYVHQSNNIYYFEPTRFGMADSEALFGPEIGIADVFEKEETPTYIIKYAIGGTVLDNQWLNGSYQRGDLYNGSVKWFKEKLEYLRKRKVEPTIIGQFWMQGEGDSHDGLEIRYETNLKNLINFYREDLKDYYKDHYTFVDAYISTKSVWPNPNAVNAGKQKVADSDSNVFCIKTNGEDDTAIDLDVKVHLNEGNDLAHYDSASELLLGQTAGKIIKENI